MPRLENWQVVSGVHTGNRVIIGEIHDDDRFPDGKGVRTSRLKGINFDTMKAVTLNTVYDLGEEHING